MKGLLGLSTNSHRKIRTFESRTPAQMAPRLAPKYCGFVNKKHQNMTTRTHTVTNQGSKRAVKEVMYGHFGFRAIATYSTNPMDHDFHTLARGMKGIDKRAME